MSKYYVAHAGQQQGPFSLEEIELKLKNHKLNWHDYIYDDRMQDWLLLMEFSLLTPVFNQSFENPVPANETIKKSLTVSDPFKKRIWYVLKQNNNYGPFSKVELIQMLQSQTLYEFDFVWNSNMKSWKRLSDVSEFSMKEVLNLFEKMKVSKDDSGNPIFYRRKHPRVQFNQNVIVHDQKKLYQSVTVEISEGGAGLIIDDAHFQKGQKIYLHIKPGADLPAFNAICKVVSHRGKKYGVQFMNVAGTVKNYIAELSQKNQVQKKAA